MCFCRSKTWLFWKMIIKSLKLYLVFFPNGLCKECIFSMVFWIFFLNLGLDLLASSSVCYTCNINWMECFTKARKRAWYVFINDKNLQSSFLCNGYSRWLHCSWSHSKDSGSLIPSLIRSMCICLRSKYKNCSFLHLQLKLFERIWSPLVFCYSLFFRMYKGCHNLKDVI